MDQLLKMLLLTVLLKELEPEPEFDTNQNTKQQPLIAQMLAGPVQSAPGPGSLLHGKLAASISERI
jgi:hypothetical protein